MKRSFVFVWENVGPTHIDRLAALAATGARVVAIEFSSASNTYDWERGAVSGFERRTLGVNGRRPSTPRLIWKLLRECLSVRDAAIFLCHYDLMPILVVALAARIAGRQVFAMVDSKFDDRPRRLARELAKSAFLLPYSGAITASHRSRDYLAFLGLRRDRLALGYDTLSVDRIAGSAGLPPAPDGTPFTDRDFLVIARLVPKKNVAMALRAFALWMHRTVSPRDLHLCGSGPLEGELRSEVDRLGIADRVHFHGFVQSDAIAARLARSLCLLLPSVEEQYGLVVIEAQAAGLPVLLSHNAGACDILVDAGVNGFTFDPANAESLAALMALVSEDETLWRRLAVAARDGCERGDTRHFVDGVLALVSAAPTPIAA